MTQRSIDQVAVDWQIEAQPGADLGAVVSVLRSDPTVAAMAVLLMALSVTLVSVVDRLVGLDRFLELR